MSWTASIGGGADWISLFRQGDPNAAHGWWVNTEGATSGTVTLSAPTQAGQYEFRYFLDDTLNDVARSSVVTVGADAGPAYNPGP
jgi:hypothetical protein